MLNTITIAGRMTKDPELRQTSAGKSVCSFTLAVDRDFKNHNEEKSVDFIDVVSWGSTAEFVSRYLEKGRLVIAKGRLQIREWTDKNGTKRRNAEIMAESIYPGDFRRTQQQNFEELSETAEKFSEIEVTEGEELPF